MPDRELLEKAARAAGRSLLAGHPDDKRGVFTTHGWWNPLTDDGEALRLAVKLRIEVYQGSNEGPCAHAGYFSGNANTQRQRFMIERHSDSDPYAATRRAIVRAAAAMDGA